MATVFDKTTDNFSVHDGALHDYVRSDRITPSNPQKHYNLRSFINTAPVVPWTMNDLQLWNAFNFTGTTMTNMQTRSIVGRVNRNRTIAEVDPLTMTQLDADTMGFLDSVVVASGNEEWPANDVNVTFGKNVTYRYSNTIAITLTGGVSKSVPSYYFDDISTDFQDQPYYIELVLRNFPAQSAGSHLNLASSFIDFSSDPNFAAGVTDSVAFSESLNDLTLGGDVTFRIPRTRLTHADLTNLRAIQFRLLSVGNMTFTAQAMRLLPSVWTVRPVEIDTKASALARSVPRAGGAELSVVQGTHLKDLTRPLNSTIWARFNTGHNPTGSDNVLKVYTRYQANGDYINFNLNARDTQSVITILQNFQGVQTQLITTSPLTHILTNETNYFMKIETQEGLVQASIYTSIGVSTGSLVYTTGWIATSLIARGDIGFSFEPYNYDFTMDYFSTAKLEYGHFQSVPFNSTSTVIGSTIKVSNSAPENLVVTQNLTNLGDASISTAGNVTTITRTGLGWLGGLTTPKPVIIGDSSELQITGSIYTPQVLRGNYEVVLLDTNNSVGWIRRIPNLLPNQWNDFNLPLGTVIAPFEYFIYITQNGFYNDKYQIRNLAINFPSVAWESTANGGMWQPYLGAINDQFTGVNYFIPGTSLAVRATSRTDQAWIEGYELIPRYGTLGQVGNSPFAHVFTSTDVRIVGLGGTRVSGTQDVRVSGSAANTTSAAFAVRVTAGLISTSVDVRLNTGTSISLPLVMTS